MPAPHRDPTPLAVRTGVTPARHGTVLWRVAHQIRRVLPRREYDRYRGHYLPLKGMRSQMCGVEFASEEFFVESGRAEAKRLIASSG